MKTYERNQAQIEFETYSSRDGNSWLVQIKF